MNLEFKLTIIMHFQGYVAFGSYAKMKDFYWLKLVTWLYFRGPKAGSHHATNLQQTAIVICISEER